MANGLYLNDRVTFVLVPMSLFEVHIARSKGAQYKLQASTQEPTPSREKCPTDEPQNRCLTTKEEPEVALKETNCVPMVMDSSQMPTDMDLHFFKPVSMASSKLDHYFTISM